MPDEKSNIFGTDILSILIYIGAGAIIAYILLKKSQATQMNLERLELKNQFDSINQYISTQHELVEQLKLLNESLDRRDKLLNQYFQQYNQQYHQKILKQNQYISKAVEDLRYLQLEHYNQQLERYKNLLKTLEHVPYSSTQLIQDILKEKSKQEKELPQPKLILQEKQTAKIVEQNQQKDKIQDTKIGVSIIDKKINEKWAVKRGPDGRIKSLETRKT